MEVSYQSMVLESLFQDLHQDHVMVNGLTRIFKEWAKFELVGCYLFMACFAWYSYLQ